LFPALLCGLLLATRSLAQQAAAPDTLTYPPRVRHRSAGEELAALPGRVVYLPFFVAINLARETATQIWERRLLDRVKAGLTTADGRAGIRPLASTQIGTGARVFYKDLVFQGDAGLTSSRGKEKRQHHTFVLSWPRGMPLPGTLKFVGQFRQEPREHFFDPDYDKPSSFLQEDTYAALHYQRRLSRSLSLGASFRYRTVDIGKSISESVLPIRARYAPGQLPGLDDRLHHLEAAFTLRGLFVDVPGSPTRGNRALVHLRYCRSVDDDAFSYFQILARTEQFIELFYRRTLALHLGTDWRFAPGDDQIPFYSLAALGGNEYLRGYRRGRFRDRGAGFATLTYKYPVWKLLDGELFYETGRTFHAPGDFTLAGWKSSYGGGLRVWVPDGLVFEQLVARSAEETRLLFNFKTAF